MQEAIQRQNQKYIAAFGALLAWFSVTTQYYIMVDNKDISLVPEITLRFFSYFTILSNTLVALCLTAHVIPRRSKRRPFFERSGVITAVATYITVVGLVYQILLRPLWDPKGLQMLVDELLHTIIPIFFLAYWYYYEKKQELEWIQVITWLIYPIVYLVFILVIGDITNFYPYPFVDLYVLGLYNVLLNSSFLLLFFITLSLSFIWAGKKIHQRKISNI